MPAGGGRSAPAFCMGTGGSGDVATCGEEDVEEEAEEGPEPDAFACGGIGLGRPYATLAAIGRIAGLVAAGLFFSGVIA